jgi:glycosyltransferase involved in cell wall biosynthesis
MTDSTAQPLTLVEVFADRAAGHWGDNLIRLARGGASIGCRVTVVAVQGLHPEVRRGLAPTNARLVDHPVGTGAKACLLASRLARRVHRLLRRVRPESALPAQARYLERCLIEASALRTSTAVEGTGQPAVVLTASPALAASVATLSRTSHVRFVHHLSAPEGRVVRALERRCRRAERRTVVVCTNGAIEAGLHQRHPGLQTLVRRFTVADPSMHTEDGERGAARAQLGIDDAEFVVAMPGGWWPYKDLDTVKAAIGRAQRPVTLVVAGNPISPADLEPAARRSGGRVVNLQGWVTEAQLRQIYAASDCALVTRTAGWSEEAATVYDAARYGTPLVVSDHDPALSRTLRDEPWARLFAAGDSESLASTLDALHDLALPRPDREAPDRLGLTNGAARVAELRTIAAELAHGSPGETGTRERVGYSDPR